MFDFRVISCSVTALGSRATFCVVCTAVQIAYPCCHVFSSELIVKMETVSIEYEMILMKCVVFSVLVPFTDLCQVQ